MTIDANQPSPEDADDASSARAQAEGVRANAWLADNLQALESSNKHVEQHGLPLAKYNGTVGMRPETALRGVGIEALTSFVGACRQALLGLRGRPGSMFNGFPRGACGPAAELVGRLLAERHGLEGVYVCGAGHPTLSANQSHAWYEAGGFIFDVTHDQFPGIGIGGWVLPLNSPWHQAFCDQDRRNGFCMPAGWLMYPHEGYAAIVSALDSTADLSQRP